MSSSFTWLDFSERDRRVAMDYIDLFRDKTTRDELGLGTVRDALADVLFPGTSTIQTRARYFLFVPWIYQELERKKISAGEIARVAHQQEIQLIDQLALSADTDGVIGIEARAKLKRLPSSVYWQGLGEWGIRQVPVALSDYHRFFALFSASSERSVRAGDDEVIAEHRMRPMWHAGVPDAPRGFPDQASLALTRAEAEYLRDQILTHASGTMLAGMLRFTVDSERSQFPWEYGEVDHLPSRTQDELQHAKRFAVISEGAPLLYNLLLAEAAESQERGAHFRMRLATWVEQEVVPRLDEFLAWDRAAFWRLVRSSNPRLGSPTRRFVDQWFDLILRNDNLSGLADDLAARQLVASRERMLKGQQSRFVRKENLDQWNGDSGTGVANYRWHRVQAIRDDILKGLGNA